MLRLMSQQCCLRIRAGPSAPSTTILSGFDLKPRSSSCLRYEPAITDTHVRLGYSLPAGFERRAFHPLGKHAAFRTHTRILHELPELSVDFTSAAWLIACRIIVISMVQAGSAEMCREIRRQTGSGTFCISYQPEFSFHSIEILKKSSKVERNSCNMRACVLKAACFPSG